MSYAEMVGRRILIGGVASLVGLGIAYANTDRPAESVAYDRPTTSSYATTRAMPTPRPTLKPATSTVRSTSAATTAALPRPVSATTAAAGLTVVGEPTVNDYVKKGGTISVRFKVRNDGSKPRYVVAIVYGPSNRLVWADGCKPSCGFTWLQTDGGGRIYDWDPLPPGASRVYRVNYEAKAKGRIDWKVCIDSRAEKAPRPFGFVGENDFWDYDVECFTRNDRFRYWHPTDTVINKG